MGCSNPGHRGRFLASADRIKKVTRGETAVEPDVVAMSKTKYKEAVGDHRGSVPRGWNAPT